jgi:hypothetical protein
MLKCVFNRLKEPSTYAGLAMIAAVAERLPAAIHGAASPAALVAAIFGVLAVVLGEGVTQAPVVRA